MRKFNLCVAVMLGVFGGVVGCEKAVVSTVSTSGPTTAAAAGGVDGERIEKLVLSNEEWKKRLTPEQYNILRENGTEAPFTGPYHDYHGKTGTFVCVGCGLELFRASEKFDSGTGWPSFYDSVKGHVLVAKDNSFGMERDALSCAKCDGHLGHVFNDGPKPTGLRYCIDGYALKLIDEKK